VILPIQDVTKEPKNYWKIVVAVIFTVWASYCVFGIFCCFAWGTKGGMHMKEDDVEGIQSLITDDLPKNWIGYGIKILFSLNLFFSYPLVLYPAHIVIENILYKGWSKSKFR